MKKDILGVKIDDLNMAETLSVVEKWIWNPGPHYIVTPNPEFVIAAQTDQLFKKILNSADLAIPDGVGLKLSGVKNTVSGTDLMKELVRLSAEKGFTVGFLGGKDGVAKKCAECLLRKYPKLKINFADSGGEVDKEGNVILNPKGEGSSLIVQNDKKKDIPPTDILFVAFGAVKQEKWIANNLSNIPVKVAVGI